MSKKTILVFIFICCILVILAAVALAGRYRSYPSAFDATIEKIPGIDFSVRFQSDDQGRVLVCTIRNQSDDEVRYGQAFYLEKERDGQWFELGDMTGKRADDRAWNPVANTVPSGSEKEFHISLDGFRPLSKGSYRIIIKIARGLNTNPSDSIAAFFEIE